MNEEYKRKNKLELIKTEESVVSIPNYLIQTNRHRTQLMIPTYQ